MAQLLSLPLRWGSSHSPSPLATCTQLNDGGIKKVKIAAFVVNQPDLHLFPLLAVSCLEDELPFGGWTLLTAKAKMTG